ncbi:MAG: hypothetical protein WA477_21475, partial [Candidatus Sulfotelmatobacter sp.]
MKSQSLLSFSVWLLAVLAVPLTIAAQETQQHPPSTTQYIVTDLGTLSGGNFSQPFYINKYGLISGSSNLADGTQHATLWLEGLMGDIGTPGLGGPNSIAFGDNIRFQTTGEAET